MRNTKLIRAVEKRAVGRRGDFIVGETKPAWHIGGLNQRAGHKGAWQRTSVLVDYSYAVLADQQILQLQHPSQGTR